jgi:hypothetical protein
MKIFYKSLTLSLLISFSVSSQQTNQESFKKDVEYLASEKLEGRFPGTNGEQLAANYIAEKFEKLDRNQDGFLTRSEAASDPALWSRFGSYDRDKDTQLSLSEYSLYASK